MPVKIVVTRTELTDHPDDMPSFKWRCNSDAEAREHIARWESHQPTHSMVIHAYTDKRHVRTDFVRENGTLIEYKPRVFKKPGYFWSDLYYNQDRREPRGSKRRRKKSKGKHRVAPVSQPAVTFGPGA